MSALHNSLANFIRKIIPQEAILPVLSGSLRGSKWIVHSGALSYWLGNYESKVQREFKKNIHKGDVVFDVGANVGFYTLLASRIVGLSGNVIAFEPEPKNINYLKAHVKLNHCQNVRIVEAAVSDFNKGQKFYKGKNSAAGSLHPLDYDPEGSISVNVVLLDEEVQNKKISPPNFIKIDVEGEECRVLRGAKKILEKYRPIVFFSTHGDDLKRDCFDLLKSFGYKLTKIGSDDFIAKPFKKAL